LILLADANVLIHLGAVGGVGVLTAIAPTEVLDGVYDECIYPDELGSAIIAAGISIIQSGSALLKQAEVLRRSRRAISVVDALCLVHAQARGCVLLTNDGPLRRACQMLGVEVMGTLGVIQYCSDNGLVSAPELVNWLVALSEPKHRLPRADLADLMDRLQGQQAVLGS
jgi:predicted nucleic acid-binding protein